MDTDKADKQELSLFIQSSRPCQGCRCCIRWNSDGFDYREDVISICLSFCAFYFTLGVIGMRVPAVYIVFYFITYHPVVDLRWRERNTNGHLNE